MVKKGAKAGKRKAKAVKKTRKRPKTSKKQKKTTKKQARPPKRRAKEASRKQKKTKKAVKKTGKPAKKQESRPKQPTPMEEKKPVEEPPAEQRVLKKLPPAKPQKTDRQVMRVFGHEINPKKIQAAAVEAYNKRCYSIDDIPVNYYIKESEWDNLITKIGILDRVEEQINIMYPHVDVVRKSKINLEIYLSE